MNLTEAKEKLVRYGQEHVLDRFESLSEDAKERLLAQIEATDFDVIASSMSHLGGEERGTITPIEVLEVSEIEAQRDQFTKLGLDAIRAGKVGAVLLAGGMGTRLGSDNPKGMFNIGLTKEVFIFQRLFENLMDVTTAADAWVHLFIMTSEKNNDATIAFLTKKNFFGYPAEYVHFFIQDMAAATDYKGKVYMESEERIATSPNGNGGWFISLKKAGLDRVAEEAGIEWLNCFAVDNVLQRIADPCFIGATLANNCVCGAKVIRKAARDEKVGVLCLEDGHPSIVEYYELTDELMNAKNEKGDPAYNFGVILNYLFKYEDLNDIVAKKLPLHVVEKKIPYMANDGTMVSPTEPNGYKYETLILDMIKMLDSCCGYEVVREREFAPIKNMTGIDSVESARELCKKNGIEL